MKRTTISLDDSLAFAVKREARRRDASVSAVARTALREHLGLDGKRPIGFVGIVSGDGSGIAGRDEEILAEIYEDRAARKLGDRGRR